MKKSFLIVRSNLRKAKGQTVAIVVLVLLAALLFNLWLMLAMDYKANFDRYHDKLNAGHVTISVCGDRGEVSEFLSETLGKDSRVHSYEIKDSLSMAGTFPYNNGQMNGWFVILPKEVALSRAIGRAEMTKEDEGKSGVYLPLLYESEGIRIGDAIEITLGGATIEYEICGFFNSVMMGSHNCSLTELILSEDMYDELEKSSLVPQAIVCSVRLFEKVENQSFIAELNNLVSAKFPNVYSMTNSYDTVIQARYISQMICSGVISAMAFFVLLIALVVIVSNIVNYIQVNLQNLGVLKATGYTSKQLIVSLLLQFLSIALLAAVLGIGLSYCLFPAINGMMISQTGIPYAIRFLPLPCFIDLLLLGGAVALSVWLSSRKIKKIEPIVALRSGVQTHNFKKNHIPLERTKAPLNLALALKTTLSGAKQNVTMGITMLVLSLVVVFSGLMTENVIMDMTPFVDLIVGEMPESCINVNIGVEEEFLQCVNEDSRVEKVYLYNSLAVTHEGGIELVATISDDFSKANNQTIVFEGRFPKFENEIALAAKYAKEVGLGIGDEIELAVGGKKATYLICGLTQISNQLGRDCLLTRDGYCRLGEMLNASYYMNLAEGTDIDEFNGEMQEKFAANVNMVINGIAAIESMATVYTTLMTVIVIAILVLSAIIIAFVLYLLVRTMLNNKMRDYGILKSLGVTSKQLIVQTALSFMPAVILSTAVGLTISSFLINPLMSLFLSSIGIVKCTFAVPVGFVALAGVGLVLVSFGIACLLSLKVKRIVPCALLVGE
ncbi:MAG: FtsX-like permease family protein [Clostridia bacterium]|nr:FtsX-like permease family protein [Clostridia bacterium]